MKNIGVEKGLRYVADYLTQQGYSVTILSEEVESNTNKLQGLDAIVTADYNTDMMGFSDTNTKVPVINASGMNPDEVKRMIDNAINK